MNILFDVSGEAERASGSLRDRGIKPVELVLREDLKPRNVAATLRRLRKFRPEVCYIFCFGHRTQFNRFPLKMLGVLAGARGICFCDEQETGPVVTPAQVLLRDLPLYLWHCIYALIAMVGFFFTYLFLLVVARISGPVAPSATCERRLCYIKTDFLPGLKAGGSVTHTREFVNAGHRLGFQMHVFACDPLVHYRLEPKVEVIEPAGVLYDLPIIVSQMEFNIRFPLAVWRRMRGRTFHGVYQRHSDNNFSGVALSRLLNAPLILECNSSPTWLAKNTRAQQFAEMPTSRRGAPTITSLCESLNLRGAYRISVVSEALKRTLHSQHRNRTEVIVNPNGVDPRRFGPHVDIGPVRGRIPSGKLLVGFIGVFVQWHGVLTLMRCVQKVTREFDHAHFLIIGDGALKAKMEDIIHRDGVAQHVTFVGLVPHDLAPAYLNACEVLVCPSEDLLDGSEFFASPVKIFEYMAIGKGIVASKTGQLTMLLVNEQDALLVEQRNQAQLAEAILLLLRDPMLRQRLGEAARRKVMSAYTWEANFHRAVSLSRGRASCVQQRAFEFPSPEDHQPGCAIRADSVLAPGPQSRLDVARVDCERIQRSAQAALTQPSISITRFPARLSEGGPNDFYSNGDYWWPDPTKANGIPYIQRDGQSNPGAFNAHRTCIAQLRDAVAALGAAYKITGEDRYVAKAIELLRAFFLDPCTRMSPHLKYAQAIPGRSGGRGTGIIDTLHLIEVPMALQAMQASRIFPPEVLAGLKGWFREYVHWLSTSQNGKEEAASTNNHSVAYCLQVAVFERFTGEEVHLDECRRRFKKVFVAKQMALDGSFPAELERTKPYGYSIFQLDNMATLCQVLSSDHDNLWTFALSDGRSIRKAMEFLFPYLLDKSTWPYKPDVQAWDGWPARQVALLFAGLALEEQKYLDLWQKLPNDPADAEVRRNIAITQPVLWVQ